jgi:hypothetical protein
MRHRGNLSRLLVEKRAAEVERTSDRDRFHLLLLAVVAMHLRTKYDSVEDARLAWLLEGQLLLARLNAPCVESALLSPTMALFASKEMRSLACEGHLLVELITPYM